MMSREAGAVANMPVRAAGPMLALAAIAVSVGNGFAQLVFSPLQELVKSDLALSDFQVGLVQGAAASVPVALVSIPLGQLVDRANRMRLLILLAVLWTMGTALTALSRSFEVLFVARALAAIGMMCALPVAISLSADLTPPEKRGQGMLILSIGKMVGTAMAFMAGGAAVGALSAHPDVLVPGLAPWRSVHLLFALVSAVLILPLLLVREPARMERTVGADLALGDAIRAIWQRRALLLPLFFGQVTVVMADAAAAVWAAPVLVRDYHQQPEQFGGWMGLVLLASGLIGAVVGGLLADAGTKGRLKGGLLTGAVAASILGIPTALYPVMPTVTGFAVQLTLFLIAGSITGLVTSVALSVLVPNEIRGLCLGAFIVVGSLFGLGAAPTLVTWISSLLGGESHLREGLTIVGVASSLVSTAGFAVALRAGAVRR